MTCLLYIRENCDAVSCTTIARYMTTPAVVYRNHSEDNLPEGRFNVIRWGCRGNIPPHAKPRVLNTLNKSGFITQTYNKRHFRLSLQRHGVSVPRSFNITDELPEDLVSVILRKSHHEKGSDFLYIHTDFLRFVKPFLLPNIYIQEKIDKDREFRVNFVQGKAVQVLEKMPEDPNEIMWGNENIVNVKWSEWPMMAVSHAMHAALHSGLYCGAVDVIVDAEDNPYVLEVNSAPELTPYQAKCFAKAFDWSVINQSFNNLGIDPDTGWKGYIHPAIRG